MESNDLNKLKVAIVGVGYVGLTAGVCLANMGNDVTCIDINDKKIELLNSGKSTIYEPGLEELLIKALENKTIKFTTDYESVYKKADVIFVCVQTPEGENGEANLDYIKIVIEQIISNMKKDAYVVLKSTISVGTCEKIQNQYNIKNIIFNPEFLSQGEAIINFMKPARIVIGVNNEDSKIVMEKIYEKFECPKLYMDLKSAEISKYACNNFLAVKLTYINEISELCEKLNINIDDVLDVMKLDNRIGNLYMEPGIGYGGSCLPKDTKALVNCARNNGMKLNVVEATIESNKRQRNRLFEKLNKYYPNKQDLKIAVLGLSFKHNTNDLRESQAVESIIKMAGNVKNIMAFDNKMDTIESCRKIFNDTENVSFSNNIYDVLKDADACMIFNKEKEILELTPNEFVSNMKAPVVLDGRNCFDSVRMIKENVIYNPIGKKQSNK